MLHTRCASIRYVRCQDMDNLRQWLQRAAQVGGVSIDVHTQLGPGYFSDCLVVTINATSENQGSIEDFSRTVLSGLSSFGGQPTTVNYFCSLYIERVIAWCEGINRFVTQQRPRPA